MIDVKSAVRTAIGYLLEFQEFIPAEAVRLEETEYDDAGFWLITLSTEDKDASTGTLASLLPRRRTYRIFKIDASSGEVKSMKVRSLVPVA
jgi:hypothetical protein